MSISDRLAALGIESEAVREYEDDAAHVRSAPLPSSCGPTSRRLVKRADATIESLLDEVERLRCCGNCEHLKWANEDFPDDEHFTFCGLTAERSTSRIDIWAGDACHFAPSRWTPYWEEPC